MKKIISVIALGILLTLIGCLNNKNVQLTPIITPSEIILTITGTPNMVSIPTAKISSSPIPLPIIPTLKNSSDYVLNLLKTNNNCFIPCIWGIKPGITEIISAQQFFQSFGWKTGSFTNSNLTIFETGKDINPDLNIRIEIYYGNGIVKTISLGIGGKNPVGADYYSVANIIAKYGKPSQVWVGLEGGEILNPSQIGVDTLLYYENINVLIQYHGIAKSIRDEYHFCPSLPDLMQKKTGAINIYAGSKIGDPYPNNLVSPFGLSWHNFKTSEVALGMSSEQIYEIIVEKQGLGCFDTPKSVWP
jgi:hypothetical protein